MALKLVKESEAAEIYRVCRSLEGTEKQRRLLNAERAHKITSYESKLARAAAEAPKGWHVCNLPPIDFHAMVDKYGYETVHSREFLEWNMKKHPEHKVRGF